MREKFLKYWTDVPKVTILANVVHPTYKLDHTIFLIQCFKRFLALPSDDVPHEVNKLWDSMYTVYSAKQNENQPRSDNSSRYDYYMILMNLVHFITTFYSN